jgi:MSHA biogenesis protein MshK
MEDPTRPPAGFYVRPGSGAALAEGGPVLQSVRISEAGRLAIISGELVGMGGMTPAGRLVNVSETEVVLQQGATRKTLRLYPGAEKRAPGARDAHSGAQR